MIGKFSRGALGVVLLSAASVATAQRVQTDFDMEFPNGNETSLISEVETFLTGKYITHSFYSDIRDGIAQVNWKDKNGDTLLTAVSNQTLVIGAPQPGIIATTTPWSTRLGVGPFASTTRVADGIGDFTGSQTSKRPCLSLQCPAQYLEPAPSLGTPARFGPQPAQSAAAAQILIDATEGRLSERLYTALPTVDPQAFTTKSLLTFASKVEQVGSQYTYTYAVTHESDSALKFDWLAAGLSGELDAAASTSRSFVSLLAPTSVPSVASALLGNFHAGGGLELLTPVPEPSRFLIVLAGLVLLAIRRGRWAYRH
jgi:hypothetical protein